MLFLYDTPLSPFRTPYSSVCIHVNYVYRYTGTVAGGSGNMESIRRRVSSVVEHLSANPKVPSFDSGHGLIPGSWIMMRHVSCILLLEWSTTFQRLWVYRISVPYAQTDPRFLFEKRRGQPREFWSLVSTIDGSTLPQDCVEEQLC